MLSTGPAAPGWLGGELAWAFSPEMGDSTQRPCLSWLPWPLGSSLKLKCDRCHFDSRQVSGSRHLWQGLQRARSGVLQGTGQAQPPWVPRAHSSIPVSSALLYPSPASFSRICSSPWSFSHFSPRLLALLLPPPSFSSAGCSLPDPPPGLSPGCGSRGSFRPNLPGSSECGGSYFVP